METSARMGVSGYGSCKNSKGKHNGLLSESREFSIYFFFVFMSDAFGGAVFVIGAIKWDLKTSHMSVHVQISAS